MPLDMKGFYNPEILNVKFDCDKDGVLFCHENSVYFKGKSNMLIDK